MLPRQRSTHIVRKISRQPAFKWKCVPDRNHFYFITFLVVHGLCLSSLLLWHIKAHPSVLSYSVLNHTEYLPGLLHFHTLPFDLRSVLLASFFLFRHHILKLSSRFCPDMFIVQLLQSNSSTFNISIWIRRFFIRIHKLFETSFFFSLIQISFMELSILLP